MSWIEDFKENVCYRIDENTRMVDIALSKVTETHIWQRPTTISNTLGNLILHVCGNMMQYAVASLGEQEDLRERDVEFSANSGWSKSELLTKLQATIKEVKTIIEQATEAQLLKKHTVQGFYLSGMGCVIHAVEHYSYHTGQIAFWVKQLIDEPLGFYEGMDLNTIN